MTFGRVVSVLAANTAVSAACSTSGRGGCAGPWGSEGVSSLGAAALVSPSNMVLIRHP